MPDGKEQPDTGAEERNEAGVPGPRRVFATLKTLGPGLVAGASDIDPTTVATMAVVGPSWGSTSSPSPPIFTPAARR
ncbi:MAG: hypothetical protein QOI75_6872 [Pseudonocardiales bacterium]|nr:hypothetical protein [Pseudonocardiales bacterium]